MDAVWRDQYTRRCGVYVEGKLYEYHDDVASMFRARLISAREVAAKLAEEQSDNERTKALAAELGFDYDEVKPFCALTENDFAIRLIVRCAVIVGQPLRAAYDILKKASV